MRKKTKYLFTISLCLLVCLSFPIFKSNAMQKILLYVNNEYVTSTSNPIILDNRVYVPIRLVAEALGAEANWDEKKQAVYIDSNIKLIASIPEEKIYLYALNKEDVMYKGLILGINGINKVFDWETTSRIEDLPELNYLDLNNDEKKELVIILSSGRGTGIVHNTIHIINPDNLNEYKVENPLDIIKNQVKTQIISEKEVKVNINGKVSSVNLDNFTDKMYPKTISKIYYENCTKYYVPFNTTRLAAVIGVEVDPTKYIGYITIAYSFKDGEFKANNISFGDFPDNL